MRKVSPKITILGIILFFAITTVYAQTPQEIAEMGRASSVSLTMNNGGSGSGFFVLSDQIVTCYHVIEEASTGYISPVLDLEEKYPIVGITAIDKDNDLVILQVSGVSGTPLSISDSETVNIQDQIYAVGDPLGLKGTVTAGQITNTFANRILMDANISHGNSGGAVLNTNGEVIGVATGSLFAEGAAVQNLNIAIPSKYLKLLLEKTKVPNRPVKPLSVDGVTGKHLMWGGNYYEFSVCNQLSKTIWGIHYVVIFKDKKGKIICADQFSKPEPLYAGEGRRIIRFLWTVNDSYYDPAVNPELYSSSIFGYVGPGTRQLAKSYEIRILGFDISPSHVKRGPLLEGVTGSGLRWGKLDSKSLSVPVFYNLQNHLDKDLNIFCVVVFYDEDDTPIGMTLGTGLEISARGTLPVEEDLVWLSLKKLTKRVEYRIYQR